MHNPKPGRKPRVPDRYTQLVYLAALCLVLAACLPAWETTIVAPDGSLDAVNRATIAGLSAYLETDERHKGVPLERVIWRTGHPLVDQLTLVKPDGTRHVLDWSASAIAGQVSGVEWHKNGVLAFDGQAARIDRIEIQAPAVPAAIQASITDLAPTAAAALGLPAPAQATGRALDVPPAEHVLLLFLDGFGYLRYVQALEQGDIPTLSALDEPLLALTTYPPVTSVSTGSLLTGAPPEVHGADRRGIRKTEVETLFDVAAAARRPAAAIEGEALAFQLRSAEWRLSGDRDGNGSTDDNVLDNAQEVLRQGMPDLLLVHFHGIDDAGHTYSPGAPEERATVREVDAAVKEILEALPADTLVLVFADHGMHSVREEGRLGNHGHLIAEDMLIPIFVWFK
jgi:hypothetical protein